MSTVSEGQELWTASPERRARAELTRFLAWLAGERDVSLAGYRELQVWSVEDPAGFWRAVWDYFDVIHEGEIEQVLTDDPMPRTRWFTGTRLNYAENILRHETSGDPERPMMMHCAETRPDIAAISWAEVAGQVRKLATRMREMGIEPGDRVVAYMPNIPETFIAMLATTAIGGIWSSAAPEFGAQTVIDRFSQIEPKLVFAVTGYRYGGKDYDRSGELAGILAALPTAERLVLLDYLPGAGRPVFAGETLDWAELFTGPDVARADFAFTRVPSDHPLWVLFSSGTTGLPKPITHGHHGIVVEHLKKASFQLDMHKDSVYFCYSTTGWMVWNTLMAGPMLDGKVVLYDGHPAHPDARLMWRIMAETGVTTFGVSPTFMQMVRGAGIRPGEEFDLSALETILLTGSPATPEILAWTHEAVKRDLYATSQSGGTEVCSGILGGSSLLPAYAGEIQAPALGCDAVAFDEAGQPVVGEVGELVIRQPMPSMPLFLWGDVGFARYTDSYFDVYPGIWRHGDRVRFNERGGSYVLGRSDATLNRFGVRIGSAEIYRTMETFDEIADSLIVCIEEKDGGYYMPLFVQMANGSLSDALKAEIARRLRSERSPRHVPDEIVEVPEIPTTLTGKKMEVPVRRMLLGENPEKVASKDATRNPAALDWFATFAQSRLADA
ncbi:acetoacetyl-CoA synthetase [Maritimibacter alkaliphilus HTCC2654]|uniref:Acetoacetyl-CoA synthase n=1 Tax=Maritimibacter alkaliphilus HTCC2654 TaxID=314271 RepID=A3VFU7_9RHOB|nr:acetoacetate--CoA ligase [Maritimibacter alkaliphilus]EAQ12723.1 Acetoacetyl-CoA synthase [Rhodobacterales bacterium HTCC2654] [Maritimibacter alkaliphilus HTCC2654]TYP81853.1 acetoacetyl-CoA synthetase [Maritimibacter alkaliphilus HTCC2654]